MRSLLAVLLFTLPAAAQFRTAPVSLPGVPVVTPPLVLPPAAHALTLPTMPGLSAPALAAPVLPAVAAPAVAVPVVSGLREFAGAFGEAAKGPSPAQAVNAAAHLFDGFSGAGAVNAAAVPVAAAAAPSGFTPGSFRSRDGAPIGYAVRRPEVELGPARIFVGGMTLPDSFRTYFESGGSEHTDYALTFRGLPSTPWTPTQHLYDADARDLARLIVIAAKRSPGGKVELALHSYAALAFQRMVQLRGDAEVDRALDALRGGRVVLFGATTHYGDSETVGGPQFAEMARQVRLLMAWIDAGDAGLEEWRAMARLNPLLIPQAETYAYWWKLQREGALAMAAKPASDLLMEHLSKPWPANLEPTRLRLIEETRAASRDPGWQEAALRRANDTSSLDFKPEDVQAVRAAGIRLDIVVSHDDQLIPYASARLLPGLFGIDLPAAVPAAGTTAVDGSGRVRVIVGPGDHYLPLKDPGAVRAVLDR